MALHSKSFSYFSLLALFRAPDLDIYLAVKHAKLACFHILEPFLDAQADLGPRWAHSHFVGFVTRRLFYL